MPKPKEAAKPRNVLNYKDIEYQNSVHLTRVSIGKITEMEKQIEAIERRINIECSKIKQQQMKLEALDMTLPNLPERMKNAG